MIQVMHSSNYKECHLLQSGVSGWDAYKSVWFKLTATSIKVVTIWASNSFYSASGSLNEGTAMHRQIHWAGLVSLGSPPRKRKEKKIQHFRREIKRYVTMKMTAFIIFDKESAQKWQAGAFIYRLRQTPLCTVIAAAPVPWSCKSHCK